MKKVLTFLVVLTVALCTVSAMAQMPIPYGPPISLDVAKKAAQVALDTARKNNWKMAVAVVDPNGTLVYYEKMDNTQLASARVAIDKAVSAAIYKRPTKEFQDGLAKGAEGWRLLRLRGAVPVDGGLPIVVDGKIIGGLGVSGDASSNDAICTKAGVESLK
ncbi:MAG: heme-binding protein [Candidatus Korobacteraceae bacterium]|jgi:uncharacterized protein GlcG (DUF336 family)